MARATRQFQKQHTESRLPKDPLVQQKSFVNGWIFVQAVGIVFYQRHKQQNGQYTNDHGNPKFFVRC